MSGLVSWAPAELLRLGEAPLVLGLLPGQPSQPLYITSGFWGIPFVVSFAMDNGYTLA